MSGEVALFIGGPVNAKFFQLPEEVPFIYIPEKKKPYMFVKQEIDFFDPNYKEHTYRRHNQSDLFGRKTSFFIKDSENVSEILEKWEFINALISFCRESML
jgi:hypothetical protein